MITEYRLVVHSETSHWGGDCIPLQRKYYFPQMRTALPPCDFGPWQTLPVVQHATLTPAQQEEIRAALT